ncbi:MAG: DNA-binding protein [Steroidobacteraceae bacterium]
MLKPTLGPTPRGVGQSDVSHAADTLLRNGMRPTIEKVRGKIGKGSPNTINPLLDAWWKTLSARLDSGPAALHRLPETVAHVAEALWIQALEEGRRRARAELKTSERLAESKDQNLEVRSHVLTLREGELDSRLRDRDRTIDDLNLRLRELTLTLRKQQATADAQALRISSLEDQILARVATPKRRVPLRTSPTSQRKKKLRRAALSGASNARRQSKLKTSTKPKTSRQRQRR